MTNPLMSMMSMRDIIGRGQPQPGAQAPIPLGVPPQQPGPPVQLGAQPPSQMPIQLGAQPAAAQPMRGGMDINALLQSIFQGMGSSQGNQPAPAAAGSQPAPASAFNPFTYGLVGGENIFNNAAGNPVSSVPQQAPPPIDINEIFNRMIGGPSSKFGGGSGFGFGGNQSGEPGGFGSGGYSVGDVSPDAGPSSGTGGLF